MRDDFSQRTKDLLANRVGWKCSNPNCRKATRGAGTGKENIINIGVDSMPTLDENLYQRLVDRGLEEIELYNWIEDV